MIYQYPLSNGSISSDLDWPKNTYFATV